MVITISGISKIEARDSKDVQCDRFALRNKGFCTTPGFCEDICKTRMGERKYGRCIKTEKLTYCECRKCPWAHETCVYELFLICLKIIVFFEEF